MPACERCWTEYTRRLHLGATVTYSEVVAERDKEGGCTPLEQCGDMHLVLDFLDGRHCRCGKVKEGGHEAH